MTNEADRNERRLTMRSLARLASDILAPYWPIGMFVHHNPLHQLESLHFSDALMRAHEVLGARKFLPPEIYRKRLRDGAIKLETVDAALSEITQDDSVSVGSRSISKLDVRRACLVNGFDVPSEPQFSLLWQSDPEHETLAAIASKLRNESAQASVDSAVERIISELGQKTTLIRWVDQTLGSDLEYSINRDLSRWCAAFLDEGEAGWPMPQRTKGFYVAWKNLAQMQQISEWGPNWSTFVSSLPERPEDAIIEMLDKLQIPDALITNYFAAHLASLPGWAAFIKWRSVQSTYAWQLYSPIDLVQYLAVRLVYEFGILTQFCGKQFGIGGSYPSITNFLHANSAFYLMLRAKAQGKLTDQETRRAERAMNRGPRFWSERETQNKLTAAFVREYNDRNAQVTAWCLSRLFSAFNIPLTELTNCDRQILLTLAGWLADLSEHDQGMIWLKASEAEYQREIFEELGRVLSEKQAASGEEARVNGSVIRSQAQAIFCIDVRSEPFRRRLESVGTYETFGFAGFFNCFIRYKPLERDHETDQFPVVMKARNLVREVPRPYHQTNLAHYERGRRFLRTLRDVWHGLKANLITPFVTVESLGWIYSVPFIFKTLTPVAYSNVSEWIVDKVQKPISTSLTVDKLRPDEADDMVIDRQLSTIRDAIIERYGLPKSQISHETLLALRAMALKETDLSEADASTLAGLPSDSIASFVEALRTENNINPRSTAAQKERLTRTGFTLAEQVFTVETSLRMMGLTDNFARIVLVCAHGSTSDNNPFESALNCGACGGNEGQANARVFAAMANKPDVRQELAKKGIDVPPDTYFLAGQLDTTDDTVELFDLEDVPPTHRLDLVRLASDLKEAGILTSQERCTRLPGAGLLPRDLASKEARQRSCDWSQVRPEWGLSRNAAFIIARRSITQSIDLKGRVFLNSYDYAIDTEGKLLENLLTAAQLVCEWINMEHYFSTVDNDLFGAGSKIYHNVTSNIGVMSGTISDLRLGLPEQTVMAGEIPYHDPIRLTTFVQAPLQKIEKLIARHELLQRYYHNQWVHLVALAPDEGAMYRYLSPGQWARIDLPSAGKASVGSTV